MKKLIPIFVYSVFLLTSLNQVKAQSWQPVGGGTNITVDAMCVFNNKLFVGGAFDQAGSIPANKVATWDGLNWEDAGTNITADDIYAFVVYNNRLYAGGHYMVKVWNDSSWDETGFPGGHLYTMCTYDGKLVIAGTSTIQAYDGSTWTVIGNTTSDVQDLAVYNGELYATGSFTSIDGNIANSIAKWDGASWSSVGLGILGAHGSELGVYDNYLYVAGPFSTSQGNAGEGLMKWDGSAWSAANLGVSSIDIMDSIAGHFYACGYAVSDYDGTNYTLLGNGFSNYVRTCAVYQDILYVGGQFTANDGNILLFVARWTDPVGMSENNFSDDIQVSPMLANDQLTISGESIPQSPILISIISSDGKIQKEVKWQAQENSKTFSISNLSNGLYLLALQSADGGFATRKFVIQR